MPSSVATKSAVAAALYLLVLEKVSDVLVVALTDILAIYEAGMSDRYFEATLRYAYMFTVSYTRLLA